MHAKAAISRGAQVIETPVRETAGRGENVLRRAQAGDAEAFSSLVRDHEAMLLRLAGRFLPRREDAEDAVQEAIVAAFRQLRRFRGECAFSTWLGRITVYRAMRLSRRRAPEAPLSPEELAAAPQAVELLAVRAAVSALPGNLRAPVVLRFYEGLDGKEIAALLGCKESTVFTRLYRGLERLRRELKEEGPCVVTTRRA